MMQQEPNNNIGPANRPVPHGTGSPLPTTSIDWSGIAPHVAEALLGPHNSRLSTRAEWRWGSRGSFRLHLDSGRWTDFEAGARGGVLDLVLRETDRTDPAEAVQWLQEQGFLHRFPGNGPAEAPRRPGRPFPASTHPSGPGRPETPSKNAPDTLQRARQDWQSSQPIPMDTDHPARRWLATRNLWWPELPLPRAVRWLPQASRWPQHEHVGAVVALAAPPLQWAISWPQLPQLGCLLYVFVDWEGRPVLDRPEAAQGLDKRTRGPQRGCVVILGDARPGEASGLVLTEGLADALAMASRGMATAVQAVGTSGLTHLAECSASWLAAWASVDVWADNDAPGLQKGQAVRVAVSRTVRPPPVTVWHLQEEGADPADGGAAHPLRPLDLGQVRKAAEQEMRENRLPRWEAARRSAILTS